MNELEEGNVMASERVETGNMMAKQALFRFQMFYLYLIMIYIYDTCHHLTRLYNSRLHGRTMMPCYIHYYHRPVQCLVLVTFVIRPCSELNY